MRLTESEFRSLVDRAITDIPPEFKPYLDGITIDIEPTPDDNTCREIGLNDPTELLGLYHGIPLTEQSMLDSATMPGRIVIYQRSVEAICRSHDDIVREVRTTVLHEIGHHLGMDEDDLEALGYE